MTPSSDLPCNPSDPDPDPGKDATEQFLADNPSHQDAHLNEKVADAVRAGVFGVSDGLVSNLALVMGVASGTDSASTVILAGVAGLLAGAFSMAAGEYISVLTQKEVFKRELAVERNHITEYPEEEESHLASLLTGYGIDEKTAKNVAANVHKNTDPALDFHARFEFGINPESLGSPNLAAGTSFLTFVIGALIPLLPWFFQDDGRLLSMLLSSIALYAVGAALTWYTPRTATIGAFRQLLLGLAATGVTYGIGTLISV